MIKQNRFRVIQVIIILLVIGIAGFSGWYVLDRSQENRLPEGVTIIDEVCEGELYEGPDEGLCIPAHYDLVDVQSVKNDDGSIREVYVDGKYFSKDEFYNNRKDYNLYLESLMQEKCKNVGGSYEKIYVGGVAGYTNLCLVK